MKPLLSTLIVSLFLILIVLPASYSQNRTADSTALVALYDSLGGPGWANNTGWPDTGTIDTWDGVSFDGSRVTSLSLGANNLTGAVPIEIGNLDALQQLYLNENQITSIPDDIGNLTSLTVLELGDNQLTALPAGIGNLSGLGFLSASQNQIATLPNEIANLISLTTLELEYNQITSLPSVIDGLTSLTDLQLDGNLLSTLPVELFNISSLRILDLAENQFTTVPSGITGLAFLESLDFGDNQLTGAFPTDVLSLDSLRDLNLGRNQLTGTIPAGISNFSKLLQLTLHHNQLTGNIPTSINTLSFLETLEVGNNSLSGNIPTEVGALDSLRYLDLSVNGFDGAVPASFMGLSNLETLVINDNLLTGLPDLTSLTNLSEVYLSGNLIPDPDLTTNNPILDSNINREQFTSAAPFTYNVSTSTFGYSTLSTPTTVTLSDDSVTSTSIPIGFDFDFFGATYNSIYISSNGFISFQSPDQDADGNPDDNVDGCCRGQQIPLSIYPNAYVAGYWEDLDPSQGGTIQYENLGSEFIVEFSNVPHLDEAIFVSFQIKLKQGSNEIEIHCQSCPSDPDSDVTTQGIEDSLGFQGFNFAGRSAAEFDLTSDAVLFQPEATAVIASDSLALVAIYDSTNGDGWSTNTNWKTGTVDTWFGVTVQGGRVVGLDLGFDPFGNGLTGPFPTAIGDLTELKVLDLEGNQFNDSIPAEIGNLTNLVELNLNRTRLLGSIPSEIGNLTSLEILRLGNNFSLSGEIPAEIYTLTNLRVFDFSFNSGMNGSISSDIGNLINLEEINLVNSSFSGQLPVEISSLSNLDTLLIQSNDFTDIPDLSGLSNLVTVNVSNNRLDFLDIEPNISVPGIIYSPQQPLSADSLLVHDGVEQVTMQIPSVPGTSNSIQWYQDSVAVGGETSEVLMITGQEGYFYAEVTSSIATELTLVSGIFNVRQEVFNTGFNQVNEVFTILNISDTIPGTEDSFQMSNQLGDINDDGFPDYGVLVSNQLRIYFGGTHKTEPDFTVENVAGYTFSDVRSGDVNGDGISDIILSQQQSGGLGFIDVYHGSGSFEVDSDHTIAASDIYTIDGNETFGFVDVIGDINNDGFDDFIVLALQETSGYVYLGDTTISQNPDIVLSDFNVTIPGATLLGNAFSFGFRSKALGDINGDNIDDFAIADVARSVDFGTSTGNGAVYVYLGRNDNSFTTPDHGIVRPSGDLNVQFFGINLETGDFNGDGLNDILVGPNRNTDPNSLTDEGSDLGFIYYGSATVDSDVDLKFKIPAAPFNFFDVQFASFNASYDVVKDETDGFDDIVISGFGTNAILIENDGTLTVDEIPNLVLIAPDSSSALGSPNNFVNRQFASAIGDFDNNGFAEILLPLRSGATQPLLYYEIQAQDPVSMFVQAADSSALVAIYDSLGGGNWNDSTNWKLGPVNTWFGVEVSGDRVVGLRLPNNNLSGQLPPAIGDLTALRTLDLQGNFGVNGPLPSEIASAIALDSLILNNMGLNDTIPLEIGSLPNLVYLNLNGNQISSVPPELTGLSSIDQIDLANNQLEDLPDLTAFTGLSLLNLVGNNLTFEDLDVNSAIPGINFHPQDQVGPDSLAALAVGDSGTLITQIQNYNGNNSYQWYKDSTPIPGETGPTLTAPSWSVADEGVYYLEATNPAVPGLTLNSGFFTVYTKQESQFAWIENEFFVEDGLLSGTSYGASVGDYDNDGLDDIWTINLGDIPSYLYRNLGDGTFDRTTSVIPNGEDHGAYGSVWGDYNNDGFLDLFACDIQFASTSTDGIAAIYKNNGDGTFTPISLGEQIIGAAWGDVNNDGLLDAIANVNNETMSVYLNVGTDTLVKQPMVVDLTTNGGTIMPFLVDLSGDGIVDLYFTGNINGVYFNDGSGNFVEQPTNALVTTTFSGPWGASFEDLDNDGDVDAFIRSYFNGEDSYIFTNDGTGNFTGATCFDLFGEACDRGRGSALADVNNDGYVDVIFNEGSPVDTIEVYLNNANSGYTQLTNQNFLGTIPAHGISVFDYDNDGYLDLYSPSSFNLRANMLYENKGSGNNWLKVKLEGTESNRAGIGAEVSVYAGGLRNSRSVMTNSGLHSGASNYLHFGMGGNALADSVVVNWPSGQTTVLDNVSSNQLVMIMELSAPEIAFDSLSLMTQEYQPELFGSVTDTSATIEVVVQGVTYPAINNMDSTWTLPAATIDSLFHGTYEVIARATNGIGTGVDTAMLVIDQSPPVVSINELVSTIRSPELSGNVNDTTAIVTVIVEDNDYLAALNTADSTWTLAEGLIQPPLEDGTYDVVVLAENQFGVASDTTLNELRLDATAPEVFVDNIGTSIVSPELTGFITDTTATITINVAGRGDFTPEINASDSTWSIPAGTISPDITEGESPVVITATAEDSLGNVGSGTGELVIANSIVALNASRITSKTFRANWSAVVDAIDYELEVSDSDDFSNIIETENTTETHLKVSNLDFESTYYYRVTYDNGVDAPTTSNVITVNTAIKQSTLDDFNSLAIIEDATGGTNWTVTSNWTEDTRKQDWDYITIENERIVEIAIPDNNLTGRFPFTPLMTALRKIDVSGNSLVDVDDLTRLREIDELDVSNNLFEFDDLEKLRELSSFTYSPQKTRLSFNEKELADSLLVRVFNDTSLSISAKGKYVNHKWFRVDTEIDTGEDFINNDSSLQILSIDYGNMGKFKAQVGNDSLPDLTLDVDSMFVFAVADFSVDVNDNEGELIPDNVDGYLLLTTQVDQGFDTLSVAKNRPSSFTFQDVILGNYLISIDSDREKYVPTYYADAFEWVEADTVLFREDSAFQVSMTLIPRELTADDGDGTLLVVIEEDFGDENARIDARRRAAKRKCGLRKRRRGGRLAQDDDEWELIAYGETDENGEFQFGFLPEGRYRFFVEYPGIPLDESSFVEFEVGEQGISDTDFKLEAFASEDGIEVEIKRVLGLIFEYFKNLKVYPNPTSEILKLSYRHLTDKEVAAQLVDLKGNVLWSKDIRSGYDGYEEIDVSGYREGIYILNVYDKEDSKSHVVSYRIIIR
ncbi:leucine-rich repeat domain-containing protein [Ekhidna sp.]|uniref:leucine-rich repeat domain-containing protein n=1 Tax=Ekhidna sp. TaxID=2608089 RepID=UPI003CCB984C